MTKSSFYNVSILLFHVESRYILSINDKNVKYKMMSLKTKLQTCIWYSSLKFKKINVSSFI